MATADEQDLIAAAEIGTNTECRMYMDALLYCYSPSNQMGAYYRTGNVDPCSDNLSELWDCLKLKMNYSATEKEAIKKRIERRGTHCTSSSVWEFRENPAKEWPVQKASTTEDASGSVAADS